MRLILVRHGETELNRDGLSQGVNDHPLTSTGRDQASAAAKALARDLPFVLYASPIARAVETAQVIHEHLMVPFTLVDGLAEANAGELEGLTGDEMRRRYPEFIERWTADPANARMPGGESLAEVQERAWRAVQDLLAKHPEDSVVVVTHNFTIQTIVASALEIPLDRCRRLRLDVGNLTRLDLAPQGNFLVSLNETWHLESAEPPRAANPDG